MDDKEFFDGLPDSRGDFLSDKRLDGKTFLGLFESNEGATIIGIWQDFDAPIDEEDFAEYLLDSGNVLDQLYEFGGQFNAHIQYFGGETTAEKLNEMDVRGNGFVSLEDAGQYLLQSSFLQAKGKIYQLGGLYYVVVDYPKH